MGWWRAREDGTSLVTEETGIAWGDGPADILDKAIGEIREEFLRGCGRPPTRIELMAGMLFSLGGGKFDDGPADGS